MIHNNVYDKQSIRRVFRITLKETNESVKIHLTNTINNLLINNYTTIQCENYNIKRELEKEHYKEFLNKELNKLEDELAVLKVEAEEEELCNNYSVVDSSDNEETNISIKKIAYKSKLNEIELFKQSIYEESYPIYIRDQEYRDTLENQINNLNFRVVTIENNEKDIYKNVNDTIFNEKQLSTTLDSMRNTQSEICQDLEDMEKKYMEQMFDLETRLNLNIDSLSNNISNKSKKVKFDLSNEINELDKKLESIQHKREEETEKYKDLEYGPFISSFTSYRTTF